MYSPRARNAANAIASEVLFWRLCGLQAVLIYGFVALALGTGLLSIRDPEFDATVITIIAIFLAIFCTCLRRSSLALRIAASKDSGYRTQLIAFRGFIAGRPSFDALAVYATASARAAARLKHFCTF